MSLHTWGVLQTPAGAACLGPIIFVLLIPRLRKLTWDVVETVLASLLLVALVLMVLGLPFGAAYITYKGFAFILQSLSSSFPQVKELSGLIYQQLK